MGMATRLTDLRKQRPGSPVHKATSLHVDEATSGLVNNATSPQADKPTSGQVDKSTSGLVDTSTSPLVSKTPQARFQRKTYYLKPDQVERIEWVAFHQKLDISEVVRQAIEAHLDKLRVPENPR